MKKVKRIIRTNNKQISKPNDLEAKNENEPIHIISLGAGVQSSTMALMAACGEILPMPIAAVFADTQAEPQSVYEWLDWLEKELPFPIYREVRTNTNAVSQVIRWGHSQIPAYKDGKLGKRQCTNHWKIIPTQRALRRVTGTKRKRLSNGYFTLWMGISIDEVKRMKPSRTKWITHRFPLIERRITRRDCLSWMKTKGYPTPPRSACVYCPYKSDDEWRETLKDPKQMEVVNAVQDLLEVRGETLHKKGRIGEIDLSTNAEKERQILWQDECEGMCGV